MERMHRIDEIFQGLSEAHRREVLLAAEMNDDRSENVRAGVREDVIKWIKRHRIQIAAVVLRITDLPDEDIRLLVLERDLSVGEVSSRNEYVINFSLLTDKTSEKAMAHNDRVAVTDLAASSAMLCEIFVELAAANKPFGIELAPPEVRVGKGSVEFTIGWTLFTSGIGLLVACGAGLVAAPLVVTIGGVTLASVGLFDLALGWKKKVAEIKEIKRKMKSADLDDRLKELEIRKNEYALEAHEFELQNARRLASGGNTTFWFANSSLVSRDTVKTEAQKLGISEGYANHLLNRVLPKYSTIRNLCRQDPQIRKQAITQSGAVTKPRNSKKMLSQH